MKSIVCILLFCFKAILVFSQSAEETFNKLNYHRARDWKHVPVSRDTIGFFDLSIRYVKNNPSLYHVFFVRIDSVRTGRNNRTVYNFSYQGDSLVFVQQKMKPYGKNKKTFFFEKGKLVRIKQDGNLAILTEETIERWSEIFLRLKRSYIPL